MTVKLAIVGCGAISEQAHIPAALKAKGIDLTALVDADACRAQRLANRFGVPHHGTTILEVAPNVDAVFLCTPPHVRPILAEQAFWGGLHVMCEKPLANTVAECDRIIEASERANRKLAVAHIFRHFPSRKAVKVMIDSREFGNVLNATATQGNPYSWQSMTGYNMRRGLVPGGVLFDAGIHPLDTLMWWFGRPTIINYQDDALGGLESNVRLTMGFNTIPEVRFRQSRTAPMTNEFRLETERASIILSNYSSRYVKIELNGSTTLRDVAGKDIDNGVYEQWQLQDFADSISNNREPTVTGHAARAVIELIEECYTLREPDLP